MTIKALARLKEAANDDIHRKTLKKTGFWGAQGAGALIYCTSTKRFLLAYRSADVEQPHTWGTWGGAIDANEDPAQATKREVIEETGYKGKLKLVPLYVFKKDTFRYSNFLALVDKEFTPRLDWETESSRWCTFEDFPTPLHFGLKALLNDPASQKVIHAYQK
jgi:8-oxo-dGTP pyrophosphatase MutT (NUDIX family)